MTREEAQALLAEREGFPVPENEHISTEALIAAAQAPAGQPCADCEALVTWSDERGWSHAVTPTGCFLARADEH